MAERLHLFPNGWSFDMWTNENCAVCPIGEEPSGAQVRCPLQNAILDAAAFDGTVDEGIAVRLGRVGMDRQRIETPCKERLLLEKNEGVLPTDEEMRRLGAPTLPGLDAG